MNPLLLGHQLAVRVHSANESFSFWKFNQRLKAHLGGNSASYGWAADIERNTPEG